MVIKDAYVSEESASAQSLAPVPDASFLPLQALGGGSDGSKDWVLAIHVANLDGVSQLLAPTPGHQPATLCTSEVRKVNRSSL